MALPPLELFSLEREGRLLPGGLFVCDQLTKARSNTKGTKAEGGDQKLFGLRDLRFCSVTCVFNFLVR
jgi:hypothetical protein